MGVEMDLTSRIVKVLVVGDPGVGKSSLVRLLCGNGTLSLKQSPPPPTVGVVVDVTTHEPPGAESVFIELWDVGGSRGPAGALDVFYRDVAGVILVHDTSNSRSYSHLHQWHSEVSGGGGSGGGSDWSSSTKLASSQGAAAAAVDGKEDFFFDPEAAAGVSRALPVLVVGTKQDISRKTAPTRCRVAEELGGVSIWISNNDRVAFAAGSPARSAVDAFFSRAASLNGGGGGSGVGGRRQAVNRRW